ncbi:MAG: heat-shock protein [Legionellales bacterium]|nr:heat-shock protein [Legionellales bacterium]
MTRLTSLDINKLTPYAVGFDRVFDNMARYMEHQSQSTGYPPYNIVKDGNNFQIEIALAGVKLADLDIEVAEGVMTISHDPQLDEQDTNRFVHRGISKRKFKRSFTLAEDVVVNGAKLENGMLYIALERIIPEEKQPRKIAIEQVAE